MGHHRNAGRHQSANHLGLLGAPFQLDRLAARFLQNPAGVFDRLEHAQVVTRKRHVDHHQRVLHRAADHFGVVDHLVERHRQRVGVPLHDHRHAVADQNAFDARRVEQRRHRVVVGREHRDLLAGRLQGRKTRHGHPLSVRLHHRISHRKSDRSGIS